MADQLDEAQRRYRDALDASRHQRQQIEEDLKFSDPSDPQQWDDTIKRQREADPGGKRPCLVFDQLGQYTSNVTGQVTKAPPSLHALPAGDGADQKVAEQLDGFFRHIEHTSRAQQHYGRALTSAARAGVGYLIVRPNFINRALNWQEPEIGSEGDPMRVVFDPWSVELDGSDATDGWHLTPLSHREFERQFGKKDKVSFGQEDRAYVQDERESIMVAECWSVVDKTVNMIVCVINGDETALSEDDFWAEVQNSGVKPQVRNIYKDKVRSVKWYRASGADYLTAETEYPADGIGIVPVYGYVGFSDGRMRYCGIPRRAMNAQRSYNYHMSEMHAYMGQAPKAPYLVPLRAVAGLEALWDRASVESRAFLPFHDFDDRGAIQAPSRSPLATNLQNHIQGAAQAREDIQAALGMYQANLGAPSNETSGVAIDSRKEQGESSTAHFPANLQASIGQVGKLCMQMIPRLIDTKRQARILGIDMTPGSVMMDPQQAKAVQETPQGLVINPNVGRYDVRVVVGANFATQRSQAQQAFTEMMRANPTLSPAIAPLWAQTLDIPHADKLAQVLTAIAPPEVKAVLQPESGGKQPTTADLMAQIGQLKQGLNEAIQHAHDAQNEADTANSKLAQKQEEHDAKARELDIAAYNAETARLKITGANEEQVAAIVSDLMVSMRSQPTPQDEEGQPEPAMQGAMGPAADSQPMPDQGAPGQPQP